MQTELVKTEFKYPSPASREVKKPSLHTYISGLLLGFKPVLLEAPKKNKKKFVWIYACLAVLFH